MKSLKVEVPRRNDGRIRRKIKESDDLPKTRNLGQYMVNNGAISLGWQV